MKLTLYSPNSPIETIHFVQVACFRLVRRWLPRLVVSLFLVIPTAGVYADTVSIDADTTLTLPSDGTNYTLKSGSGFNSLDFSSDTFSFTGGGSASVDLRSGDKKTFTNNRNITTTCGDNESQIVVPATSGNTTLTPSGTCGGGGGGSSGGSGGSTGSGGSGGGGGSFAPTAPTIAITDKVALIKQQIASIQASIQQKLSAAGVAMKGSFTGFAKNLAMGDQGDDVKALQVFLAGDKSIYPEGIINGIFGPATKRAITLFQKKYGLAALGLVGPQTRAKLGEVFGAAAPSALAPAVSSAAPVSAVVSGVPSRTLNPGDRNDEVKLLQQALAAVKDIYPEGVINGVFGPATTRAVRAFQMKYGIISAENDAGSGRFGAKTKAKFEEIFGGVSSPAASSVSAPAVAPVPSSSAIPDAKAIQEQIHALQVGILQAQIKAIQDKINAIKK